MKVCITGGAGMIGANLAYKLIDSGHDVSVIDDLTGGDRNNIPTEAKFYLCDLRQPDWADEVIKKIKPEIVYHLAANAAENKAQFSPIDISTRNWNTFINTITPAIRYGMRRFIFTSSIAVYGDIPSPFIEDDQPRPEDIYGITKLAIEESIKVLATVHEFEYVIARPHNVYGKYQNRRDPYRNVVTIWMNSILKGEPYFIYGDGEQKRCFTYVDDVVDAMEKMLYKNVSGMTFNLGADREYTLNELSNEILNVTGFNKKPLHLADRPQEVKIAVSDHTRAKTFLDYKDTVDLHTGILKMWEWLKPLGAVEAKFDELELPNNKKVPANWIKK